MHFQYLIAIAGIIIPVYISYKSYKMAQKSNNRNKQELRTSTQKVMKNGSSEEKVNFIMASFTPSSLSETKLYEAEPFITKEYKRTGNLHSIVKKISYCGKYLTFNKNKVFIKYKAPLKTMFAWGILTYTSFFGILFFAFIGLLDLVISSLSHTSNIIASVALLFEIISAFILSFCVDIFFKVSYAISYLNELPNSKKNNFNLACTNASSRLNKFKNKSITFWLKRSSIHLKNHKL